MALTRKLLKDVAKESDIELTTEFMDSIIKAHTETRDLYAEEQKKPLQEQLDKLGKETPDDVKESTEYKALETKLNTLQGEYDTYKTGIETKELNQTKIEALKTELIKQGANEKFIDRMIKTTDLSTIEVKDGVLDKTEEVVTGFKTEWGDVFGEMQIKGAEINKPLGGKQEPTDPFLEGFDD